MTEERESRIKSNVPAEPNSFVGRERELGELCRLVRETRLLSLSGAGGIGKTRLALRVLAAVAGEFQDGGWFIELGDQRQPDLVVSRIAATVGIAEEPGRPLLDTLTDALRPRRILLVLDNCEHLLEACARACQHLLAGSPGLHVVATTREPLQVAAETVWHVPPLTVAPAGVLPTSQEARSYEAVRLFADRAAAAQTGFTVSPGNAVAIAQLCRALDGMPLAIELAAARVPALSVEQIAARLADRFGLLTTGARTAPPRQRTLRSTIDWSYGLLCDQERILLRRLSVFAGWSLEMAEHVCSGEGLPSERILDLTAALLSKSLVVREPDVLGQARYRMLDTIREYAAGRLAEAGESTLFEARLRDYTLQVAEYNAMVGMARVAAPWSARVDVFHRWDVDTGNVLQVLNRCLSDHDAQTGMRICTAVGPCWIVRGSFAEGGEWLDAFLALDAPGVPGRVRGAAMVGRAQLALSSDPAAAESFAEQGLKLCQSAADSFWIASALNLLSEIALHTSRAGEAASCADEALSVAQLAGDGWNEGYSLGTKATIAALQGRLREAQQLAKTAITVMRRIDQQWGVARALLGLGDLARLRGDPGDARRRYTEALGILREINARPELARCLAGLGRIAMDLGARILAREYLTESIQLSQSTGSRIGVARGLEAFAALAVQEDQRELAVLLTAAATALREAAGLPALSGARAERYLASARSLGEAAISRLWAQGLAIDSDSAVLLALRGAAPETASEAVSMMRSAADDVAAALPNTLTPREREVVKLIASGYSNKAIAGELFISPATAARHVANILAKLGFSSRTQIAAWAAGEHLDRIDPGDQSAS